MTTTTTYPLRFSVAPSQPSSNGRLWLDCMSFALLHYLLLYVVRHNGSVSKHTHTQTHTRGTGIVYDALRCTQIIVKHFEFFVLCVFVWRRCLRVRRRCWEIVNGFHVCLRTFSSRKRFDGMKTWKQTNIFFFFFFPLLLRLLLLPLLLASSLDVVVVEFDVRYCVRALRTTAMCVCVQKEMKWNKKTNKRNQHMLIVRKIENN